jgi:uncharacterized protein YndB with AHSA1/START domain
VVRVPGAAAVGHWSAGYINGMANPRDIVTVERVIRAPAAAIFDVLADPARHPEIDGSGTVKRAQPGHSARLAQGATFAVDMHRGIRYAMINTVTEFDEGRRIAWSPKPANGRGARLVGRTWRYELDPVEGGTRVRETWDITQEGTRFLLRYAMAPRTRKDMVKSLERLDGLVTG